MKVLKTTEAVGEMLCHDITQIIPGVCKGPAFRKGHIIREEDIPVLLSIGKENVYIWETDETMMHENDAAQVLYKLCCGISVPSCAPEYDDAGDVIPGRMDDATFLIPSKISEGKIELTAGIDGLLKIDRRRLCAVNSIGEMMIAARHGDFPVRKGDKVAGTRVIPLTIARDQMERAAVSAAGAPILRILPFKAKRAGVVTTGSEVFNGLIEDKFTPVIEKKLAEYGSTMAQHRIVNDDLAMTADAIREMLAAGCDLILCTGGMSVDPDDRTPQAIRSCTDEVISYGAPVLPGAMFMLGYKHTADGGRIPVCGLPGCVMYAKRTIFDLVLPRLLADDPVSREEIDVLGEGGLCLGCAVCTFPNCGFGKGGRNM